MTANNLIDFLYSQNQHVNKFYIKEIYKKTNLY
jgi:hypothetical protein